MKDDQRKGERLRSVDGDGDDGLSFLLGLVFFSIGDDGGDHLPLVSLGFGINPQVSWDMVVVMKGEEDQTIEEGLDLW